MLTNHLYYLNSITSLKEWMDSQAGIYLYGAGYYLDMFLQEIETLEQGCQAYIKKINCIFVSNANGNPARVRGIPIIEYQTNILKPNDCVLLTLGHRYTDEVYDLLKRTGALIAEIDFNMFQEIPYHDVEKSIMPFLKTFPEKLSGWNMPCLCEEITAWSCWWQGEEHAPELVRACLESQRRNLPQGVKHVVITADNYKNYIALPEYILEKVNTGDLSLTTLSDLIRASLLYRYGGFWMDSTLLVCRPLESSFLDYTLYTRNLPETQYCTNAMWSGWFMYSKPGNKLFCFLMESFFYYFSVHDKIKYYFMIDYLIAIACNTFQDVENQLKSIPYNNEGAQELAKHITEPYDEQKLKNYLKNSSVQKLSYKIAVSESDKTENTFYRYIIKNY